MKRLKLRLQFTGWLQYIPTAFISFILLIVSLILWILGQLPVAYVTLIIGLGLLARLIFDLVTVKLKFHPPEALPISNEEMGVFDLMRNRHSCRSFQNRKLTDDHRNAIIDYANSHTGAPDCKLLGDNAIRFEYVDAPLTVWPVVGAQEFLVAIAPSKYNRTSVIDVGRCLQKIVIHATKMGIDTCWIGPGADHESAISHLGDRFKPTEDHIICLCALGYESKYTPLLVRLASFKMRRRLPFPSLMFADPDLTEPLPINMPPFNRFGRCFEACQWSPSSFNAQPTRLVGILQQNGKESETIESEEPTIVRVDFYTTIASRFYAPVALGIWCANWEMGCEELGIEGSFAILPPAARGEKNQTSEPLLPKYDMSWVLER